jgi:negative regulator of sigma E activity
MLGLRRSTPWLLALACIAGGGIAYFWRDKNASAGDGSPDLRAQEAVAKAWTVGRSVPLKGKQTLLIATENRSRNVEAEVLQSGRGEVRIKYLTAPLAGVTVWESADRTYRYNPKNNRLTVSTRRDNPEAGKEQEERLLENYTARVSGTEKVANRTALVIELRPKGGGNRWKRLWIDPNSWVTLASEDRRGDDQVLRRTRFTAVTYLPDSQTPQPHEFRPSEEMVQRLAQAVRGDTASRFTPAELSKLIEFEVRVPQYLPKGYKLQGAYPTPCSCSERHQAARLEFSDGLNTLTLFECAHPRCISKGNCFAAEGASSPLSFHLERKSGRYLAVGDAPKSELEKLVRSAAE